MIDLGRTRYRPSQQLRDAVVASHLTCVVRGCDRPVADCEIDHRHERRDGGGTDLANLEPLCVFHHILKTKRLLGGPDGEEAYLLATRPLEEGEYDTFGERWKEFLAKPAGSVLFLLSLLQKEHPDATPETARTSP